EVGVGRAEGQREIEIGVVAVVAEGRLERGRQVAAHQRAEGAADAAGGVDDGVLLGDGGFPRGDKGQVDRCARQRRRSRDMAAVRMVVPAITSTVPVPVPLLVMAGAKM